MFSIYILSQLNTTVLLFALGGYDQYFGVQMQKDSEKGRRLPKTTQCVLFRGQGGAIGKVF